MSNIFRVEKSIVNLPDPLFPDTVYFVRVGEGFDFYCSDITGTVAHKINSLSTDFIIDGGLYDSENDYVLNIDMGGV